mgnify:CR=1 FL=1
MEHQSTAGPAPEAKPALPRFAVGQVWERRDGKRVRVERLLDQGCGLGCAVECAAGDKYVVFKDGSYWGPNDGLAPADLVHLVSEPETPEQCVKRLGEQFDKRMGEFKAGAEPSPALVAAARALAAKPPASFFAEQAARRAARKPLAVVQPAKRWREDLDAMQAAEGETNFFHDGTGVCAGAWPIHDPDARMATAPTHWEHTK